MGEKSYLDSSNSVKLYFDDLEQQRTPYAASKKSQYVHRSRFRFQNTVFRQYLLIVCALFTFQIADGVSAQAAAQQCDDVIFMPKELTLTFARDSERELIDLHSFNRFFTFQIPTDTPNVVQTRLDPTKHQKEGNQNINDMVLRLRASFRAASMDYLEQSMRVSVIEEASGQVILDGSTEDSDERSVHLDSIDVSSSKAYILKYEFFEKNAGFTSYEERSVSSANLGASACSKPFVVQELYFGEKSLITMRAKEYHEHIEEAEAAWGDSLKERDLSLLASDCKLSTLNNSARAEDKGDDALYCGIHAYLYPLAGQRSDEFNTIWQQEFSIAGASNKPVTYAFDLTLAFEFPMAAQLKAVLQRVDSRDNNKVFKYSPLDCLKDHSCVETELISRNQVGIRVILTSGDYKLTFFDQERNDMRNWLVNDVGLAKLPFALQLTASPIIQNEERAMCGDKLFLREDFIQNRFIQNRKGKKFTFEEFVILNFMSFQQKLKVIPEEDMLLRMSSKEAYGVNVDLSVCVKDSCLVSSQQVGNTEILFTTLKKGTEYHLTLKYSNSIIQLSSFFDCPHFHLMISMIKLEDAKQLLKDQKQKSEGWVSQKQRESDQLLGELFNNLSRQAADDQLHFFGNTSNIFYYDIGQIYQTDRSVKSHVLTQRDFSISKGDDQQLLVEIFYEPLLYDLEILIESKDANELKTGNSYAKKSRTDASVFKGAKKVFAGLEHGDYTLKVIAKIPGQSKETESLNFKYAEFQLYMVTAPQIKTSDLMPTSLNYFGLLGPRGDKFGQHTQLVDNLELEPRDYKDFEFILSTDSKNSKGLSPHIDVQAIEMDGKGNQLDISLTELPKELGNSSSDKSKDSSNIAKAKEKSVRQSTYVDEWEEGVAYESLISDALSENIKYRVRVRNRDMAENAKITLKIIVTERQENYMPLQTEILPKNFDEVKRIKPYVPGFKESSFILGSRRVMDIFKAASLEPFVAKSKQVYQAKFKTGANTDDHFMTALDFEVEEDSAQIFAQVIEYSGREDLFVTIYSADKGSGRQQLARSSLGKYANALGPVTLTKGKYNLIVHPDQESTELQTGTDFVQFTLDVLFETRNFNQNGQSFNDIVQEISLCGYPSAPPQFNGPAFIHPLAGNSMQHSAKYRISNIEAGSYVPFELSEPSLIDFYIQVPEGLGVEAELVRIKGTHKTLVTSDNLNRLDETFLRNKGGYQHKAVVQIREFLDVGEYQIRVLARNSDFLIMPRCEGYQIEFTVSPVGRNRKSGFSVDDTCLDTNYLPEHLKFDEALAGTVAYPITQNVVDVAYIDLKGDGEGPFLFSFQIQYDPRIVGVVGISLSVYDTETSAFRQAALYKSPQDGINQILTVAESGIYAFGIQTLTSTSDMFISTGLGSKARQELSKHLIHQNCLKVSYSYLITTTLKQDSRVLPGGPLGILALMFSGGMQRMLANRHRDGQLLNEIGDSNLLTSCVHDDFPKYLPQSSTGFDLALTLLVQEKPFDVLDLVVEQESLIRVTLHSSSAKNQLKAYLYKDSDSKTRAIGWTTGGRMSQTMLHLVSPQKKAYRLKIEYDSLDQDDPCPKYELRIIVKPIKDIVKENLACKGRLPPPEAIPLSSEDFAYSGSYGFGSDYVASVTEGKVDKFEFDIVLQWPNADINVEYLIDMETDSDFLTNQMSFALFYEDKNKLLRQLGGSRVVHQQSDASIGGKYVQRLSFEDRDKDIADDITIDGAIIRLKLPTTTLQGLQILKERNYIKKGQEVCFNFQLSLRAEKVGGTVTEGQVAPGASRLLRVRWEGQEEQEGVFDPREHIIATLEFDRSVKEVYKIMKTSEWASLVEDKKLNFDIIQPSIKKLSADDSTNIILLFSKGSLSKGKCFTLKLSPLYAGMGQSVYFEDKTIPKDLKVCTSNCSCFWKGTQSCENDKCICKFPYMGEECDKCMSGHHFNQESGECEKSSKCVKQGGDVDCNGHGVCKQKGDKAVCTCDPAFTNDGNEQCARCIDQLFTYPGCQTRSWIIDEPDFNCRDLDVQMPSSLYGFDGDNTHNNQTSLQGRDGVLNWAARYRLVDQQKWTEMSSFKFMVPAVSVFRLFLDTIQSGSLVKYRLLDNNKEEILSSSGKAHLADEDGFVEVGHEITILHEPKQEEASKAPFFLQLQYKQNPIPRIGHQEMEACPVIDIRLVIEPFITAQGALKCSEQEQREAQKQQNRNLQFGSESVFEKQKLVLRSDDDTLFTRNGERQNNFASVVYKLNVRKSGNALSIITRFPFTHMLIQMSLTDDETGGIVSNDRTSSLEDTKPQKTHKIISRAPDMASFIEISALDEGSYTLELQISRSQFLPTKQFPTCLSFDLVFEYINRVSNGKQNDGMYEILAVYPLALEQLEPTGDAVIDVVFDKELVLDDLIGSAEDRLKICSLYAKDDKKSVIYPRQVRQQDQGKSLRLEFDFFSSKDKIPASGRCYSLQCSTQLTKGKETIRPMQEETSYCFGSDSSKDATSLCNPNAEPKLSQDGKCVCAAPYSGQDCEKCDQGFKATSDQQKGSKKSHTICELDHNHMSQAVCNSHGRPKSSSVTSIKDVKCVCDKGYGGAYCDYCTDASFAYPDCAEGISSLIYDSEETHAFLARRQYNEHGYSSVGEQYFPKGALEPTVFNEECAWVDFPDNLDRVEYAKEFLNGAMHFADLYVVNHKQDNIIKFKPQSRGILKILVQQPESFTADSEAEFDIEIGVYDPEEQKFIASSMNRHLDVAQIKVKLEYAALTYEVQSEHLGKTFYIFFRALNFTDDGAGAQSSEGCLALFIEAEFKSNPSECQNLPQLQSSQDIEVLKDNNQAFVLDQKLKEQHSIQDQSQTFFAYKDFYIPATNDKISGESDREITISLQQKFIEANTLDILIEVLQNDVELNEINKNDHSPRTNYQRATGLSTRQTDNYREEQSRGNMGPNCKGECIVGGEKAFNEMLRVLELGVRTYFRVWIFQTSLSQNGLQKYQCSNYQLFVSMRPSTDGEKSDQEMHKLQKCPAEELPSTLNQPRYLTDGRDGKQKDFHYRQSYRIDHLWHNQEHKISFKLLEPSVVRILAPVHKHLQFEILLNEDDGHYHHKTIVRAKREDHHSTIFAQLDSGEYHFKLAFLSDAALMKLPCQTLQIELAIMTIKNAKEKAEQIKLAMLNGEHNSNKLSMVDLLTQSAKKPLLLYRPSAVGWRHVEPGLPLLIDQSELYIEIQKETFEIEQDDEAGLLIDVHSDFLLYGMNIAINNVATGQIVEDERRDSSGKILVGRLVPGKYELIIYTHECVTNMDPVHGGTISTFDLLFTVSLRLLKIADQHTELTKSASIPVEVFEKSGSLQKSYDSSPWVIDSQDLKCLKDYSHLPKTFDDKFLNGRLDIIEAFFIPSSEYYSHEVSFTPKQQDHDSLRILLSKANSKVVLFSVDDNAVVAQSKPVEKAKAQLLIAAGLKIGKQYVIMIEFSEDFGTLDGEAAEPCKHFIMQFKTWNSKNLCPGQKELANQVTFTTKAGEDAPPIKATMLKKFESKELIVQGKQGSASHIEIVVDYSDAFYRPEVSLQSLSTDPNSANEVDLDEDETLQGNKRYSPSFIDFAKKDQTTYFFNNIQDGKYSLKLRSRFKTKGCLSPVTLTFSSWEKVDGQSLFDSTGNFAGVHLFQSQAEEQERPRSANRLPLDLNTFKFLGGQQNSVFSSGDHADYLLFSGALQLDELESQNVIKFKIDKNFTLARFYAEHSGIILTLHDTNTEHKQVISGGMNAYIFRMLMAGSYELGFSHATQQARKIAEIVPPRTQLTIMIADDEVQKAYNLSWGNVTTQCERSSNFPMALRQQKMTDIHQLYYNYDLIKVSPDVINLQSILQTYNFRINVTSRMYFEVGMHLKNNHVTLQLSSLNDRVFSVQGKQRGNLNVMDIQIGAGDYSLALKHQSSGSLVESCGVFSLQGLVEPINLMSAKANSGEIVQRGIKNCPQADDGDIIPLKIYGSKALTKGGGELHIDASGHFTKRFRNVLVKSSGEYSESQPEYDRVDLEVTEDAWLHLSFLYDAYAAEELKVVLSDTFMLGSAVAPQASFKVDNIENDRIEQVLEYKLAKGRHYSLTIYYVGAFQMFDENGHPTCSVYDLTLSISHVIQLVHDTRCSNNQKVPSFLSQLPTEITDKSLDAHGEYKFEKILKLSYKDYAEFEKQKHDHIIKGTTQIALSENFDIFASIEFEFDQAFFTMSLTEIKEKKSGKLITAQSHMQSPLFSKQNNDHFKSVIRELGADDVESDGKTLKHVLKFENRQPELLHLINPDQNSDGCLYFNVKIYIRSAGKSLQHIHAAEIKHSNVSPMITMFKPYDSPTFLHGRPELVSFDIIFNKRPYAKEKELKTQDVVDLRGAFRLRASTVSVQNSAKSDLQLIPISIHSASKEYREDEYHVGVKFDISEFQDSATEKLLHAQLVIIEDFLVDSDLKPFIVDKYFKSRGLPIYVFEQNDIEQLLEEESNEVKQAIEETVVAQEGQRKENDDLMTEKSDFEKKVEQLKPAEAKTETKVRCLCVHGKCKEREQECTKPCESGWTGIYCDMPSSKSNDKAANRNQDKDYTKDGLYRPQSIGNQRATGKTHPKEDSSKETQVSQKENNWNKKSSKKIEDSEVSSNKPINLDSKPVSSFQTPGITQLSEKASAEQQNERLQRQKDQPNRWSSLSNILIVSLLIVFFYYLTNSSNNIPYPCPKRQQRPQKKYGPIGENVQHESDSEGDDMDFSSRRKMLELSSLSQKNSTSQNKGNKDQKQNVDKEQSYTEEIDQSQINQMKQRDFPLLNFNVSSNKQENTEQKIQNTNQNTNNNNPQSFQYDDDSAAQLQKELELFSQEGDEEALGLMNDDGFTEFAQPQNQIEFQGGVQFQQQNYNQYQQQYQNTTNTNYQEEDELQQYENYFEQN